MLPSDYISMTGLYNSGNYAYIDTGVIPKSTYSYVLSFAQDINYTTGYVFGARTSSSNSSQGQTNFYLGQSAAASYFGYNATRNSKTLTELYHGMFHISINKNTLTLVNNNAFVYDVTGTTTYFQGVQPIHLFGLNNAGNHLAPDRLNLLTIYGFRVFEDGAMVKNFIPAKKVSTSELGMYETVGDVFYPSAGSDAFDSRDYYLADVTETDGGQGFIYADGVGYVKQQYYPLIADYIDMPITIKAIPNNGYSFDHWELNGVYLTNEEDYSFTPTEAVSLKAYFSKEPLEQTDPYRATVLAYGVAVDGVHNSKQAASYLTVLKGEVNEDLLQRSTTTLTCLEIPSSVHIYSPVVLYNSKGKIIYIGTVIAIEDNKLICRELIAIYDDEQFWTLQRYKSYYTTVRGIGQYLGYIISGTNLISTKDANVLQLATPYYMPLDDYKVPLDAMPLEQNGAYNLEDKIMDAFSKYNVMMDIKFIHPYPNAIGISISPCVSHYNEITINDGMEAITDLSVTTKEVEATILKIYNSANTQYLGEALIRYDGNIDIYEPSVSLSGTDLAPYIAYDGICKQKVVNSDDNIKTVALANLNGSNYYHKITFTLNRNNIVRFEDLHLGQRINFYVGDKLYKSILTSWSYSFDGNNQIKSMKITLGNVRTNLTSIMNIKKK